MKLVRYFFVGGMAAIVDIGLFALLARLAGLPWFPVALFSFTMATLVNYVLSVRHVFESGIRFSRTHEVMLVFIVSSVGLGINQAVLWFCIESAQIDMLIAKVCASATVFFWNYGARRYFIFRERSVDTGEMALDIDRSPRWPAGDV